MKCIKLTYKSPLYGSVYCEGCVDSPDSRVDFGPYGVLQLYNRGDYLMRFLSDRSEDLKEHIPEELQELVVKAVFGIDYVEEGKVYLLTEIYAKQEPNPLQYAKIQDWMTSQLSDGWGEGLEQQQVLEENIRFNKTIFDDDTCEFVEEEICSTAYYYVHPWSSNCNWFLHLAYSETVELDIPEDDKKQAILEEINANLVRIMNALKDIV